MSGWSKRAEESDEEEDELYHVPENPQQVVLMDTPDILDGDNDVAQSLVSERAAFSPVDAPFEEEEEEEEEEEDDFREEEEEEVVLLECKVLPWECDTSDDDDDDEEEEEEEHPKGSVREDVWARIKQRLCEVVEVGELDFWAQPCESNDEVVEIKQTLADVPLGPLSLALPTVSDQGSKVKWYKLPRDVRYKLEPPDAAPGHRVVTLEVGGHKSQVIESRTFAERPHGVILRLQAAQEKLRKDIPLVCQPNESFSRIADDTDTCVSFLDVDTTTPNARLRHLCRRIVLRQRRPTDMKTQPPLSFEPFGTHLFPTPEFDVVFSGRKFFLPRELRDRHAKYRESVRAAFSGSGFGWATCFLPAAVAATFRCAFSNWCGHHGYDPTIPLSAQFVSHLELLALFMTLTNDPTLLRDLHAHMHPIPGHGLLLKILAHAWSHRNHIDVALDEDCPDCQISEEVYCYFPRGSVFENEEAHGLASLNNTLLLSALVRVTCFEHPLQQALENMETDDKIRLTLELTSLTGRDCTDFANALEANRLEDTIGHLFQLLGFVTGGALSLLSSTEFVYQLRELLEEFDLFPRQCSSSQGGNLSFRQTQDLCAWLLKPGAWHAASGRLGSDVLNHNAAALMNALTEERPPKTTTTSLAGLMQAIANLAAERNDEQWFSCLVVLPGMALPRLMQDFPCSNPGTGRMWAAHFRALCYAVEAVFIRTRVFGSQAAAQLLRHRVCKKAWLVPFLHTQTACTLRKLRLQGGAAKHLHHLAHEALRPTSSEVYERSVLSMLNCAVRESEPRCTQAAYDNEANRLFKSTEVVRATTAPFPPVYPNEQTRHLKTEDTTSPGNVAQAVQFLKEQNDRRTISARQPVCM